MYDIPFVKHVIISGGSKVTAVTAGLGREVQRMQPLQRSGGRGDGDDVGRNGCGSLLLQCGVSKCEVKLNVKS